MDISLIVTADSSIPLYLQVKHQISYLISSRKLLEGSRIPTVHDLAKKLGINPATVARAYRELQVSGLVTSVRGKGTFVRALFVDDEEDFAIRHDILVEALNKARRKAYSLGFSNLEIQQEMDSFFRQEDCICEVAFIGSVLPVAQRFSKVIEKYLYNDGVKVLPFGLDSLSWTDPDVNRVLESLYYFVTTSRLVHRVEMALQANPSISKVIGLSTGVTDRMLDALSALTPDTKACLIVQERFLHSALNLIKTHSSLSIDTLSYAFDADSARVVEVTTDSELVIHTLGVRALLDHLEVPKSKRLEVIFEIKHESLKKLKLLLNTQKVFKEAGQYTNARI